MRFIKTIAAFMAAGLMLTATGCAAGGSKAKEAMTDAVDSYLSKVLVRNLSMQRMRRDSTTSDLHSSIFLRS